MSEGFQLTCEVSGSALRLPDDELERLDAEGEHSRDP
jgi:hypothetical protein